ncbi:MAG TPA: Lrp/AsnC family transcriptional regulator [Dehalococcoidia bacterium]|nr:Lrp/AsnC family transcriptional regulator [Dehalococcoidia bacterium]
MAALTDDQREVLAAIQDGLPLEPEPYRIVAERVGMSEERVLALIASMLAEGKIKRIGAVPNHYALGITANGMSVWDVPDAVATEVGRKLGARDEITHCYKRPRQPGWPYNIFGMVHARSREEVVETVERIAHELGIAQYPHDVLFSTRLLKKRGTRVRSSQFTVDSSQSGASE